MAITASDIHNQSFSIDRKGYDVDEVDVFLEHVADEIDILNDTIAHLQDQLEADRFSGFDAPAASTVAITEVAAATVDTSEYDAQLAQKDAIIADLERQLSDKRADDNAIAQALIIAQRSADEILAKANANATETIQDARDEAQRIIDRANTDRQDVIDAIRKLQDDREDAREEMAECERALAEGSESEDAGSVRGGNIVLDHVSRSFGRKVVLDDITLTMKGGELVAIVGSSGGGKSTLGSIILGTLKPTRGRVVFGGRLGFVPQRNLVHENLTVAQQLDFYARAVKHLPRQKARERVDRVVRELGLQKVRRTLIRKCSGGEKRRVSVACELLSFPDGLVLDEPTSGLDPGDSGNLVAVLHSLVHNRRMTALVINHDYENIQLFDKICFLAHGKVCFYGTPDKLFEYFDTRSTREIYTLMDKDPYPFIRRFEEWRRDHSDELGGIC